MSQQRFSVVRQRAREAAAASIKMLSAADCDQFPDMSADELDEVDAEFARIAERICKTTQGAPAQKDTP